MTENDIKAIDCISQAIYETLKGGIPELEIPGSAVIDEIRQLISYIDRWACEYKSLSEEILRLSNGDINSIIKSKLAAAHSLKNLQATLKHLTWQARQVAEGDFSQRLEFLGDFSDSFNWMVNQLDINHKELIRNNIELEKLASTDTLTSIGNRRSFFQSGKREFERAKRYHEGISVFILDIDFFKKINDRFGHAAGDEALKLITQTCTINLRSSDILGRIGGEEFGVIMLNADNRTTVLMAERLRKEISTANLIYDSQTINFTTSIGLALINPEDESFDTLLNRADVALYKAKNGGRNCVVKV